MLENIKVDIIYYCVPKDFEMEFNLCGCCRMRLLNSVADDIKSLISCMKLAVARSRVIFLCGDITGENNLFTIVSKAIGRENEEIENSLYGISAQGTTALMKNSIPLISKDGILCGCVVEQGPQSIIILSPEKEKRKEIMRDLIHPYIKELSNIEPIEEQDNIDETDEMNEHTEQISDSLSTSCEESENNDALHKQVNVEPVTEAFITQEVTEQAKVDTSVQESLLSEENTSNSDIADMLCGFSEEENSYDEKFFYSEPNFSLSQSEEPTVYRGRTGKRSKHSKSRNTSPILTILICFLLCLIGILAYFLILKPLQSGISISDNFFRLIPFLSRRFF